VARSRKEPRWLTRLIVDAVHNDQIREHGGLPGLRDETGLESALARPLQKWHYQTDTDVPALAAAYAFGLIKNHPYRDGNKRIGFLSMVTFLGLNGYELTATDTDVVSEFVTLATGNVSEGELTDWVNEHCRKRR
jgi:death-on-curing protein